MSFDTMSRRKFQWNVLQDQFRTVLNQFQEHAHKWLDQAKINLDDTEATVLAKTSKGVTHPNHILAELKRLNYERAYIEYKIQALEHNIQIPMPEEIQRRLRKSEMDIKFQHSFPKSDRSYQRQLKKKLREKPYRPNHTVKKTEDDLELDLPIFLNSSTPAKNRRAQTLEPRPVQKKPPRTSAKKKEPSTGSIIRHIRDRGTNRMINQHGYFQSPFFTREKVETILGQTISNKKFHQVRHIMNSEQRKLKLGKAKSSHKKRKGNRKIFPF